MVLFILVYFVATTLAKIPGQLSSMAGTKIETTANNTIGYLQFDDTSFNLTDFTVCAWIKFSYLSHSQTIFRLTTENGKESAILWRVHARPTTVMRMTINNQLVASENVHLAKKQWTHVCFQWKGWTGVWVIFVNAKIHSIGQTTVAGNDTMTSAAAWKLRGKGAGIVGDDSAPCRNVWQMYGLYLAGSAAARTALMGGAKTGGKPSSNVTVAAGKTTPALSDGGGKVKNSIKRQAVYDSDSDEPSSAGGAGSTGSSKPFQWFTKTLAFVKRVFTFVIIPFFKFVRNTFFQTRSLDDTVVDVSETHLTISDVKVALQPAATTTTAADAATTTATTTTFIADSTELSTEGDDFLSNDKKNKRHVSSSSRSKTTVDDHRCDNAGGDNDLVTTADLLATGGGSLVATDNTLSANARRYLRIVSDSLNDVGVNVAFVKRAFACCRSRLTDVVVVIDWDRTLAKTYNLTTSPHVCG